MLSHFLVGAARSVFTGRSVFRSGFDMFVVGLGVAVRRLLRRRVGGEGILGRGSARMGADGPECESGVAPWRATPLSLKRRPPYLKGWVASRLPLRPRSPPRRGREREWPGYSCRRR